MKKTESPTRGEENMINNHHLLTFGHSSASTSTSTAAEQALDLDLISKITQQKPKSSINPEGRLIWPVVDRLENLGAIRPADDSAKLVRMKVDKLAKAFKFTEKAMSKVADSLVKWPKEIDAPEFEKFSDDMARLLRDQSAQFEALRVQMEFISMGFKSCSHEEKAKASTLYRINKLTKNLEQIRKKHNVSEDYKTVQKDLIDADSTLQRQKYRLRQNANYELRKHYLNYVSTLERSSKNVRESCDLFFTNASQIEFDDNLESCTNHSLQQHQQKLKMIQNSSKDNLKSPYGDFPVSINESALNIRPQQRRNIQQRVPIKLKNESVINSMNQLSMNDQQSINNIDEEYENTLDNGGAHFVNDLNLDEEFIPCTDKRRLTMINLSPQKKQNDGIKNKKLENYKRRAKKYNNDVSVDPESLWGHPTD